MRNWSACAIYCNHCNIEIYSNSGWDMSSLFLKNMSVIESNCTIGVKEVVENDSDAVKHTNGSVEGWMSTHDKGRLAFPAIPEDLLLNHLVWAPYSRFKGNRPYFYARVRNRSDARNVLGFSINSKLEETRYPVPETNSLIEFLGLPPNLALTVSIPTCRILPLDDPYCQGKWSEKLQYDMLKFLKKKFKRIDADRIYNYATEFANYYVELSPSI